MKMKNTYSIIILIISSSVLALKADEASFECIENTFDLTLNETIVEEKKVTFVLMVNVSHLNDEESKLDYFKRCFKSIKLAYKKSNRTESNEVKPNMANKLKQTIQILHLDYLSTYTFNISFIQYVSNGSNGTSELAVIEKGDLNWIKVNTCFGRPENPRVVSVCVNKKDGSVEFEWEPTKANDAPYPCYFNLTIVDFTRNKLNKLTTTDSSHRTARLTSQNLNFYVSSVNAVECYLKDFPFANECKSKMLQSNVYLSMVRNGAQTQHSILASIDYDSLIYSLSSTTTDTSITSYYNSSNRLNYPALISLICLLISFL